MRSVGPASDLFIPASSQSQSQFIMCVRIFLFLFFLLSASALTRASALPGKGKSMEDACERYIFPICTRDYNPVCGSDGKTYANECMLCFDIRQYKLTTYIAKKGEC